MRELVEIRAFFDQTKVLSKKGSAGQWGDPWIEYIESNETMLLGAEGPEWYLPITLHRPEDLLDFVPALKDRVIQEYFTRVEVFACPCCGDEQFSTWIWDGAIIRFYGNTVTVIAPGVVAFHRIFEFLAKYPGKRPPKHWGYILAKWEELKFD